MMKLSKHFNAFLVATCAMLLGAGFLAGCDSRRAGPDAGSVEDTAPGLDGLTQRKAAKDLKELLDYRLPSIQEAETMIHLNIATGAFTETLRQKFEAFVRELERRTGKRLPVKLAPEVGQRSIPGWDGMRDPFSDLLQVQQVTVAEFLGYVADDLGLDMTITETAVLFTQRAVVGE